MAMASPPPPLPQQPAPACSFFPQHDELQTLAAQMLRSQSTPTPMASPPRPPPPQQPAPAPARSFFPQVDELQTLAAQMLRSQSAPNLMASLPPPPPPPHPQLPAPARSFPQHEEVQTLAAQMLRSQSTPIPTASPPPPPPPPQQPAPGFSFYPQEHELVQQYLRPKLHGSPLPSTTKHFFHDADVYAAEPATLASLYPPGPARAFGESQNWYFFCPVKAQIAHDGRRPRIVAGGKGTWKSDRGKNVVDPVEGCVVGRRERFTYVPKPKEEGKPTEWLMTEFSVDQQEGGAVPGMVLYKIYRSPRFLKNASKASSSSSASVSARKRKAADELLDDLSPPPSLSARKTVNATSGSSSPVRRQLLFPSPPAEVAPNPPAEVAPNNLTAEVDEMMAEYLADDKNWEGFSCIANPSSAPWSCSMMTMASNPLCSGPEFLNSIVAAP